MSGLQDSPEEFTTVESLRLLAAALQLGELLLADAAAGVLSAGPADHAINNILQDLDRGIYSERKQQRADICKSWASRVQTSLQGGVGWAHRWTRNLEAWKPATTYVKGRWSGRPSSVLEGEAERLAKIWDTQDKQHNNPVPRDIDDSVALGPMNGKILQEAARSFSATAASTWDGVHPRHLALITEQQADIVAQLMLLIESLGFIPSQIQAIISALRLKHKQQDKQATKPTMRSIGMMSGLYRAWARARQSAAREWEIHHRIPLINE